MSKEILEDLKLNTKFSEDELSQWYENFQKQCPSGRISPEEFKKIYERIFPDSDAATYAQHVFRSFDTNDDGTLDFKEYIIALHMTSTGKTERKLEWAFSLFDVDKNGYITKSEVAEICQVGQMLVNIFISLHLWHCWVASFRNHNINWWVCYLCRETGASWQFAEKKIIECMLIFCNNMPLYAGYAVTLYVVTQGQVVTMEPVIDWTANNNET